MLDRLFQQDNISDHTKKASITNISDHTKKVDIMAYILNINNKQLQQTHISENLVKSHGWSFLTFICACDSEEFRQSKGKGKSSHLKALH